MRPEKMEVRDGKFHCVFPLRRFDIQGVHLTRLIRDTAAKARLEENVSYSESYGYSHFLTLTFANEEAAQATLEGIVVAIGEPVLRANLKKLGQMPLSQNHRV